jgi:hypothetical protein
MEWVSTTLGGGKINQFPTVFTEDSKYGPSLAAAVFDPHLVTLVAYLWPNNHVLLHRYFFCPSGDSVKMFSVTTGEQTRILQGHTGKVIGTAINPENPLQVRSSCSFRCSEAAIIDGSRRNNLRALPLALPVRFICHYTCSDHYSSLYSYTLSVETERLACGTTTMPFCSPYVIRCFSGRHMILCQDNDKHVHVW